MKRTLVVVALGILAVLSGCSRDKGRVQFTNPPHTAVIGISADVDNLSPLFANEVVAGEISELIFPMLVGADFDTTKGVLLYKPGLAKSWEFVDNHRSVVFHLRNDVKWADGVPVTGRDVQFTYRLYGDPELMSLRAAALEGLIKKSDGTPDIDNGIRAIDDTTIAFRFEKSYPGQLFDAGLPLVPAHVYGKIPKDSLMAYTATMLPVGTGGFKVTERVPLQHVVLSSNPMSILPGPAKLEKLIYKVIPDYQARLAQFESGLIDIVLHVESDDAARIGPKHPDLAIYPIRDRRLHFVGWNNIDGAAYKKNGKIVPHPLFGKPQIRRALTLAINRDELVYSQLGSLGKPAFGAVSPIFRWAFQDSLKPLPYDPEQAKAILAQDGWRDVDNDGVLERGGRKFSFSLDVPAGNQFYVALASVIQQHLKRVHIELKIEQLEYSTLMPKLMEKQFDAFILGLEVPLQLQLEEFWSSDLDVYPYNFVSYQNKRVDGILRKARYTDDVLTTAPLWKEFQEILLRDQPFTFLLWETSLVGVNRRVKGIDINLLGTTHNAWEWSAE